jgi:ribosomal-protein-alanine N-acetyltransferase
MHGKPIESYRIETARLEYVQTDRTDLDFFSEFLADPVLSRFLPYGKPYPPEKAADYVDMRINHWQNYGFGTWVLKCKSSGKQIGFCGLEHVRSSQYVDIRYGLIQSLWGAGLAREAAAECLHYGFMTLNLPILYGAAVPANKASIRVLETIGMRQCFDVRFYGDGVTYFKKEQ